MAETLMDYDGPDGAGKVTLVMDDSSGAYSVTVNGAQKHESYSMMEAVQAAREEIGHFGPGALSDASVILDQLMDAARQLAVGF